MPLGTGMTATPSAERVVGSTVEARVKVPEIPAGELVTVTDPVGAAVGLE